MKPALIIAFLLLISGCASSYIPPGGKADLEAFAPADIEAGFAAKPSRPFPAGIAAVRIQAPNYSNHHLQQQGGSYGSGRYSVVLAKEIGEDTQLERVAKLDQVAGIISLNRMLLPQNLDDDLAIRKAASRLQADLVLLYTFDTAFFDADLAKPLSVITLGLSPTRKITAATTCSALLMDTRTGYIYSAYEATEKAAVFSTSWGSHDAADKARRNNEEEAFKQLIDELALSWPRLLERYGKAD